MAQIPYEDRFAPTVDRVTKDLGTFKPLADRVARLQWIPEEQKAAFAAMQTEMTAIATRFERWSKGESQEPLAHISRAIGAWFLTHQIHMKELKAPSGGTLTDAQKAFNQHVTGATVALLSAYSNVDALLESPKVQAFDEALGVLGLQKDTTQNQPMDEAEWEVTAHNGQDYLAQALGALKAKNVDVSDRHHNVGSNETSIKRFVADMRKLRTELETPRKGGMGTTGQEEDRRTRIDLEFKILTESFLKIRDDFHLFGERAAKTQGVSPEEVTAMQGVAFVGLLHLGDALRDVGELKKRDGIPVSHQTPFPVELGKKREGIEL